MKQPHAIKVILFAVAMLALGVLAFKLGENLFTGRELREPAALRRSLMDFSNLPADRFQAKVREHLRHTAQVERKANDLLLSTGHFLGPRKPVSACTTYKYIEYYLRAEGIAVSGEPPRMKITALCEPSGNHESIETVKVNIIELVSLSPKDQVIQFTDQIKIEMVDFPDEWPNQWVLEDIVLKGDFESLSLGTDEVSKMSLPIRTVTW